MIRAATGIRKEGEARSRVRQDFKPKELIP